MVLWSDQKSRSAWVALVVAALVLSGCTWLAPEEQGLGQLPEGRPISPVPDVTPEGMLDAPDGTTLDWYRNQKIEWADCRDGLQCATVMAPLDYDEPDGMGITLAMARKPSKSEKPKGSLFINPGGPGGSGVDFVSYFEPKGLEDYDLIGWDPRGVSNSTPVRCFSDADLEKYNAMDSSPDNDQETLAWMEANREFGAACLANSGALLEHISTEDTVRDLDLLRGLVGDQELNYFGSSYGTSIGSLYAELFPAQVGHLVLDGAVNITADKDTVTQTQGFDRALGNFASWCAERKCTLGDSKAAVLESVIELWTGLDQNPIPGGRAELTQALAVTGVSWALYQPEEAWPYLLEALQNAIRDQDGAYLLYFADQYFQRNQDGTYGQFSYAFPAIRCLDEPDEGVAGAIEQSAEDVETAPTVGRFFGPDLACPMWPVKAVREPKIDGAGAKPIVVIGTTGDPATPYEYAVSMAKQLKSGVLITLEGEGHLAYGQSDCVKDLVADYFVRDVVPADGETC